MREVNNHVAPGGITIKGIKRNIIRLRFRFFFLLEKKIKMKKKETKKNDKIYSYIRDEIKYYKYKQLKIFKTYLSKKYKALYIT